MEDLRSLRKRPALETNNTLDARAFIKQTLQDQRDAKAPTLLAICTGKLEALIWVVAAVGFLYWGDGEHSTYSLLSLPSAIRWGYLWGALACAGINAGTFLYVQLYLRLYKGVCDDPELSTPWAVPLACASCILAWVLCCFAGWGVWGWFTPVVLSVEAIGSVMFLCHFMPAIARYKTPLPEACSESA